MIGKSLELLRSLIKSETKDEMTNYRPIYEGPVPVLRVRRKFKWDSGF